ncbi:MAG: hypothetical protein PHP37_01475 [Patescibacteria group bacterium]|nr:hypothetical protein [Patescibacteria group bacterium]
MDNKKDKTQKEQNKDINLNNYRDMEGDSLRRVNFGLWFLKNRRTFFLSIILILILLSIILYSRVFYNLYVYIKNRPEELRALKELSTISVNFSTTRSAKDLEVFGPQSFFHSGDYDFVGRVKNPNDNFFAFINYCFLDGEEELACSNATVLPNEDKYLVILSKKIDSRLSNLKFVIKNSNWQRVDVKKYGNWSNYFQERSNFLVSNTKFESNSSSGIDSVNNNNLSFIIKNNSPYNYWEVPLLIVMFNYNNIVGVNRYTVREFMSLDEKNVNLSWSNSISSSDRVEVIPEVNILDDNNYIKYK